MDKIKKYSKLDKWIGQRIDKVLVFLEPTFTRNYIQRLIAERYVMVKTAHGSSFVSIKASYVLKTDDVLMVKIPPVKDLSLKPKKIDLNIVYEDKDLLVINKTAGMVVHPGDKGSHSEDSLVNAMLYHCGKDLSGIGGTARPGIVHRLDKDTSGLLIVAKNDLAHQGLVKQFKEHQIEKFYFALVAGSIPHESGFIEFAIGRDLKDRKKMAVAFGGRAKMAKTKFIVKERFENFTLCEVKLLTGRTHQIRVHFEAIGFPLVGDPLYGKKKVNKFFEHEFSLTRQFLHARQLIFKHPVNQKTINLSINLSPDLEKVLSGLRKKS